MPEFFNVYRLAVIDLHGARGTTLRRRLVLIEFPLSVALAAAMGGYLISFGGIGGWISGVWLLGIAANYVPLTMYAAALSRPGRLAAAVRHVDDYLCTARFYSVAQWRLIVPFLVVILALRPADRGSWRSSTRAVLDQERARPDEKRQWRP